MLLKYKFLTPTEFRVIVYKYSLPPLEIYTCSLMSSSERRWWNITNVRREVLLPAHLKDVWKPKQSTTFPIFLFNNINCRTERKTKLFPNSNELPYRNWYLSLGSWISLQITSVENTFSGSCGNPEKYLRCRYLCCKHLKFGDISLSVSRLIGKKLLFNFTFSFTCEK